MDSSIKNPGETEYDKQNWLHRQKNQVLPKNSKWGLRPLATVHKLVPTKKFPIETLLEMMDSSVESLGEVESFTFKSVLIRNFFVMDRFMYSGNSR